MTVAVLTYLRPADLQRCLRGLLPQVEGFVAGINGSSTAGILVVDNDPEGSAAVVVAGIGSPKIRYVHEPSPGISAARNRALADSNAVDLLIFMDDDEEPHDGWLDLLVGCWRDSGATAVAGRVVSAFDGTLDPWIARGGFFRRRSLPTGTFVGVAATNNLLLDLTQVREFGIEFDSRFGLSGGGDTHFTRSLIAAGGSIVWCDEAVVTDHVPAGRMTRYWVLSRARRNANTEVRVNILLAGSTRKAVGRRAMSIARGIVRVAAGSARHGFGWLARSMPHEAAGMRTAWRGAGMIAGAVGITFGEYHRQGHR